MHRLAPLLLVLLLAACETTSSTAAMSAGLEPDEDGWRGNALDRGRTMPEVTLVDTNGQDFTLDEQTAGSPTLLFFGYANCFDYCPVHLHAIASSMSTAGVDHDDLQVVFVTVDPERDTPEAIDDWLGSFDSQFIGLSGEMDEIQRALDALDLPGPVVEGADPRGDGELIGHPAQVIGFDAEGEARRVWPFGARRADWVADLPRTVDEWS